MNEIVTVEKLSNGLWIWVCQPDSGAFYQSGKQYKRKADAHAAGLLFAAAFD